MLKTGAITVVEDSLFFITFLASKRNNSQLLSVIPGEIHDFRDSKV